MFGRMNLGGHLAILSLVTDERDILGISFRDFRLSLYFNFI